MAGDYPALHWWPTIVTAWALGVLVLAFALKMSRDRNRSRFHVATELFSGAIMVMSASGLLLGVSTWLGLHGLLVAVATVGVASLYLLRGPAWARRTVLGLHVGLVMGLLASHWHFSAIQRDEGKVAYGLLYGSGASALKPMLKAMPLAELFQLTEKSMPDGQGAKVLSEAIEERSSELYDLKDAELEALAREPMSSPLKERLDEVLRARKRHSPSSR